MIKAIVIMTLLASSVMLAIPLSNSFKAFASTSQPELISTKQYQILSAKWWKYLISVPPSTNPILGGPCDAQQKGPVFYLVGTFGGSAERSCTIPQGKVIFFPVINTFATVDKNDPNFNTIDKTKTAIKESIDKATDLQVSVDGVNINLDNARAQSPPFSVKVPRDNVLGPPEIAGTYPLAFSDGYWVGLEPLDPGEHTIHFAGTGDGFSLEVTYHITVQ
jgi:hypothetical protein